MDKIIIFISRFLALLLVLPVHEFAHAFAAIKSGDPTPRLYGRYSLNPLAHFDRLGLICFVVAGFGWAKPVPVNPNNFRNYKRGCFFTSIAGVAANYALAFLVYPLYLLSYRYVPVFGYFTDVLVLSLYFIFALSLTFFVFNLLPIYPLDGFRVVDVFAKRRGSLYTFLRTKGMYVLYALFALSLIADLTGIAQLDILGFVLSKVVGIIEIPIVWFWRLFL